MKVKVVCTLLILLLARCDSYADSSLALEITWEVTHAVDMLTTLRLVDNPRCIETNPILGPHPSQEAVIAYGIGWAVLHPVISYWLPTEVSVLNFEFNPRLLWQGITIGISSQAAIGNIVIMFEVGF